MPRLMIELTDEEWGWLVAEAKRERRTPQAQGAVLLTQGLSTMATLRSLAEAQRAARGAGDALPAQEQVGAVEGHRDGAAGGVDQVVVGGPGEPE